MNTPCFEDGTVIFKRWQSTLDKLLNAKYEYHPSNCSGIGKSHIHAYRQQLKKHEIILREAENM
jgi:hypothetical protein